MSSWANHPGIPILMGSVILEPKHSFSLRLEATCFAKGSRALASMTCNVPFKVTLEISTCFAGLSNNCTGHLPPYHIAFHLDGESGVGSQQLSPDQNKAQERLVKSHPELSLYDKEECEERRRATLGKHLGGKISSTW